MYICDVNVSIVSTEAYGILNPVVWVRFPLEAQNVNKLHANKEWIVWSTIDTFNK